MIAIVLGGSGAVGSVCAAALRTAGWDVQVRSAPRLATAARTPEALAAAAGHHCATVDRLVAEFVAADVVVNAAGLPTITAPASDALFGANALLPGLVGAAAARAGVRRVIHIGSVAVQGRRDPLDESTAYDLRSPYARARALGEGLLDRLGNGGAPLGPTAHPGPVSTTGLGEGGTDESGGGPGVGNEPGNHRRTVVLRLPSVLGSGTSGQRATARIARSPLCSVAADRPRPLATAENVGAAVAFLAAHAGPVPPIVLQPDEGHTTRSVLDLLGGRRPRRVPVPLARAVTAALRSTRVRRLDELSRGLELLWLGQSQAPSWLTAAGFTPARAPRPLRIGVLTHWYKPERGPNPAPTAERLAERGHDVAVLTGFPNYPLGRIYDGWRQRWGHRERDAGVTVRRVPLYPSHDTNGLRRAFALLSFAASSTLARGFLADRDVVYVYASPMTAAAAALALRRVPFVLHVIDLWPDSVLESGMAGGPRLRRLLRAGLDAVLARIYRRAAHIVAVTPGIAKTLVERGVPAEKVSVVYNWSEGELVPRAGRDPELRAQLGRPGHTLAVFAGNVGQMQDVTTIVRAAALCQDDTRMDVAIIGAGTAFAAARDLADEIGAKNVRFFDRVDSAEMPRIYAASDYQLVTLIDRPLFHVTVPSKFGDALAAGCPVITNVPGDAARMCADGGFGFACPPEDPEALAEVFRLASAESEVDRSDKRRRAREFYRRTLSMRAALDGLEAALEAAR